jgi:hypothetical protein
MSHQSNSQAVHKAAAELLIENLTPYSPIKAITQALAEVWLQGEHHLVRSIINNALSREIKVQMLNGTRSLLPNDLMKDAFDRFMAAY